LLLHDKESTKLKQAIQEKGMTVIPLSMYFSGPYVKVEIAIVRGKKLHDKREDLKKKDIERDLRRGE
jgi:SsrA-binding protein